MHRLWLVWSCVLYHHGVDAKTPWLTTWCQDSNLFGVCARTCTLTSIVRAQSLVVQVHTTSVLCEVFVKVANASRNVV